ncbi:hypothetical protein DdX_17912 [Ditylenchus destructor]|uniref:Uncharacterized protein n=1 Tax=Ditylenchus destructor TaxID=166010 RepID=A0AAD4QYL0_9BILA|nr:hypothetical protein DdX_17912 [Ditylenchus destructor]
MEGNNENPPDIDELDWLEDAETEANLTGNQSAELLLNQSCWSENGENTVEESAELLPKQIVKPPTRHLHSANPLDVGKKKVQDFVRKRAIETAENPTQIMRAALENATEALTERFSLKIFNSQA